MTPYYAKLVEQFLRELYLAELRGYADRLADPRQGEHTWRTQGIPADPIYRADGGRR